MAIPTTCPHCRASFRFADEMRGKRVRCKSCEEPFVVRRGGDEEEPPARERIRGDRPSPAPAPRRRRDEDEDAPRRPGRRSIERPSSGGGAPVGLIIGGVAALGLIVLAGVGGAAYFLLKPAKPAPAAAPLAVVQGQPVAALNPGANPAPANPPPLNPPAANPPAANLPARPANPAPRPRRPRRPTPPANPPRPANPGPGTVAAAPAAPAGPAGLRYRWDGAPHVYRVRAELQLPSGLEVHEGTILIHVKPGQHRVVFAEERKATGTGFVVNANGYLVTCAHVVAETSKVEVALGGKSYPAKVLAVDNDHDLALLQIEGRNLPVLPLADSDAAAVGQEVRALGYPLSSVLGDSLKATRGTVSGIDKTKKTFHIDAAINPGNSGGPVLTEAGAVLGVNSAKLAGEAVSNVGFATPSSHVKKLLADKSVAFTKGGGAKLDGPTLVSQASPAVALITVTLPPDVSAETFHLSCRGALVKSLQAAAPTGPRRPGRPAVPSPQSSSPSEVHVDAVGRVLENKGGTQLPALMGDMGLFLLEPLPPDDRTSWAVKSSINVGEAGTSPGWRYRFGQRWTPLPAPPKNVRVATENTTYRRGAKAGNVLTVLKHYELKVPPAGDSPAMQLVGDGTIQFDTQAGMPRSINYKALLTLSTTNARFRVPVKAAYTLLEGEERENILHPPKAQPKVYTDAQLTNALAILRGTDERKKWPVVTALGKARASSRREEVAAALGALLQDRNNAHRRAVVTALYVWGTKDNVPALLPLLGDREDGGVRAAAVKTLGEIRDERAAEPLARLLPNFFVRRDVVVALRKIGSKAEKAVAAYLTHADAGTRVEACKLLGAIGTTQSKPALDKASTDSNPRVADEARKAADEVARRS
jgi:predicted Zn finger-like uncharacterized protein